MFQKELLRVIRAQRGKAPEGFVRRMQEVASEEEDTFINNHLLLFTSALVPKAISSLLTTFAIEVSRPELVGVSASATRSMFDLSRPDMTSAVDWALKSKYLSIYLSIYPLV